MIWCPSLKCESAIKRQNKDVRIVCEECGTNACFSCQKTWHEGACASEGSVGLFAFFFLRDVRKCPNCKTRIQKNGGCPHMNCFRCHHDFCWCCMGQWRNHNHWYSLCPKLPFSICVNILLVLLAMILMPAIFTLGPLGAAIYFFFSTVFKLSKGCRIFKKSRYDRGCRCFSDYLIWFLVGLIVILPLYLAVAAVAAALLLGLASVPAIYYGFAYIIRVTYNVASS